MKSGTGGHGLYLHPLHVVFRLLLNEVDAFQHVGDVVDSSLLHFQHLRCLGNVFALGDTDEDSELLQGHAAYIAQSDRYDQPFDLLIPIWISERSAAFRL